MNEELIRQLMKESLMKTSDGFTDKIMGKIDRVNVSVKMPRRTKVALLVSFISFLTIPQIWLMLKIPYVEISVLFFIPIILLSVLIVNKYLYLNEVQKTI